MSRIGGGVRIADPDRDVDEVRVNPRFQAFRDHAGEPLHRGAATDRAGTGFVQITCQLEATATARR